MFAGLHRVKSGDQHSDWETATDISKRGGRRKSELYECFNQKTVSEASKNCRLVGEAALVDSGISSVNTSTAGSRHSHSQHKM